MFWKLFRLQELLDALFDDGWFSLGLQRVNERQEQRDADIQTQQA